MSGEPGQAPLFLDGDGTLLIERSRGVEPAGEQGYETGAYVAAQPWLPLSSSELPSLGVRRGVGERHDTLSVVTLPHVLTELLRELACTRVSAREHVLDDAVALLLEWLREVGWESAAQAKGSGFRQGEANNRSLTREASTGELVGLHIDSWDGASLRDRRACQNRLCVNLGSHTRAFQFIPVQAYDLARASDEQRASRVVQRFLSNLADYPVLRVHVTAGQAYIAPTENLVHDACTLSAAPDATFTVRGRFDPKPRTRQSSDAD